MDNNLKTRNSNAVEWKSRKKKSVLSVLSLHLFIKYNENNGKT